MLLLEVVRLTEVAESAVGRTFGAVAALAQDLALDGLFESVALGGFEGEFALNRPIKPPRALTHPTLH